MKTPFSRQLPVLIGVVCFLHLSKVDAQICPNPIACENLLAGDTGWDINGAGDTTIQGFATDISVDAGEIITFKVNTSAASYRLDIYRMGYYDGTGARKITTINPSVTLPQTQPSCLADSDTKLVDCGNWEASASWAVPSTAVSGIYFAHLVRADTGGASHIVFVVRNDASRSDILFKTSDETWQAHNYYGGRSLQGGNGTWDLSDRAFQVSYNRPFYTRAFEPNTWVFSSEYATVRWLEANGYDVSYFTGIDAARKGVLILNHKVLISVGRDEYVSGPQRLNIEAARDAGVNLAFFSGGEAFWKTKWANSVDGTNTPFRTLVCYRETLSNGMPNPVDPLTWTGTWRDPRFSPPSDGGYPENSLTGLLFKVNAFDMSASIEVPAADGRMRFWRNTTIAALADSEKVILPAGTLGSKWDSDVENGIRPAGLVPLSTTTRIVMEGSLLDYGAIYGPGIARHRLAAYRAPSGALVFSAGTPQWTWGLDSHHDGAGFEPDLRMQQATVNLFADMDVQPATLQPSLVAATRSTDRTPPTSAVTSTSIVQYGIRTTITGTATDSGGGVVGVVEVSVDDGQTWKVATGRENWTYEWTPLAVSGSSTVLVRATDDSANLQLAPTKATFSVAGGPTMWADGNVPDTLSQEALPVELGMKFRSDVPGYITAVRFYKAPQNTGTHTGNLWTIDGTRLASVTFTDESPSGWQQANFSSPVRIAANTTYVVSYYAPNGGYAASVNFFKTTVDRGPLHALADGLDGPNSVYIYAAGGGFPKQTFNATNYWVDIVFSPLRGGPHSVVLTWSASTTPGVTGYNIYRATLPSGPYEKLNASTIAELTYTDSDVISGQTYFYVTTAVDQMENHSLYSNEAVAIVATP